MLGQQDSVGLILYDERIREYVPPRSIRNHLHSILQRLDPITTGSGTRSRSTFRALSEQIKRRGLIIIISDLFDDPEDIIASIKHFRHRKHEVIVFRVLDSLEKKFSFRYPGRFRDMETGEEVYTRPNAIRNAYLNDMKEQEKLYARICRENSADYLCVDTSTPFDHALLTFIAKRSKLG